MRRPILAAVLLALVFLSGAPLATAAARLEISDVDVFNDDDKELMRVANQKPVRLTATITNSGDADLTSLLLVFRVRSDAGTYEHNRTLSHNLTIGPGKSADVSYSWTPAELGRHTLEVWVQNQRATLFTLKFTVAEHEVIRQNFDDRVLGHAWVYAAFVASLALFFGVARVRRSR